MKKAEIIESVQRMVVRLLAQNPAGEGLCLIGGFRYRLLDGSVRRSDDLDYHWAGDLEKKQQKVVELLRRKLQPEIRDRLGFDSRVSAATGPDADSPLVRTVELALYRADGEPGRVESPIDITSIVCLDKPVVRTVDGVVYLSASDADMFESKVIALFLRPHVAARDMLDIFLFQDRSDIETPKRLAAKFRKLKISPASVTLQMAQMRHNRARHAKALDRIIEEQVDSSSSANLKSAGGGAMVFDRVMDLLAEGLRLGNGRPS